MINPFHSEPLVVYNDSIFEFTFNKSIIIIIYSIENNKETSTPNV